MAPTSSSRATAATGVQLAGLLYDAVDAAVKAG